MTSSIFLVQGSIFLVAVVIVIYLIIKRIEEKKKENFEKRDN